MKTTLHLFGEQSTCRGQASSRKVDANFLNSRTPIDAAEAAFDLSNNPDKEETWRDLAGPGIRSLSVGDVVQVWTAGQRSAFLCMHSGWADITMVQEAVLARLEHAGSFERRQSLVAELNC